MLNKKLLLVVVFAMVFFAGSFNNVNCSVRSDKEDAIAKVAIIGFMSAGIVATYLTHKILNKSDFYNKSIYPYVKDCCYVAGGIPYYATHNINPNSESYYFYLGGARIFTVGAALSFMTLGLVAAIVNG